MLTLSEERKFHLIFAQGSKIPRNESSRERKYQGAKVPCNFHSRERKYVGTKVPVTLLPYWEHRNRDIVKNLNFTHHLLQYVVIAQHARCFKTYHFKVCI